MDQLKAVDGGDSSAAVSAQQWKIKNEMMSYGFIKAWDGCYGRFYENLFARLKASARKETVTDIL